MGTKICKGCKKELSLCFFNYYKASPDKHGYTCKECLKEEYGFKNKGKVRPLRHPWEYAGYVPKTIRDI